ncbi:hypothetical protein HYH03_002644 [Edaphochlamys debaryana]|uniref:Protein kinase domain-containing protein n=1 Tax=Edaphochlamys debaryana TaxID=47281 RepID=A0A835YDH4_9CHLO|nr:hypothetical protein HYH03_002644 [Edaphochlamys debaryana]|eukprot:KAG2499709.1 hypothetical protein HYH03_002644 [Edaphochlamys debaryana]
MAFSKFEDAKPLTKSSASSTVAGAMKPAAKLSATAKPVAGSSESALKGKSSSKNASPKPTWNSSTRLENKTPSPTTPKVSARAPWPSTPTTSPATPVTPAITPSATTAAPSITTTTVTRETVVAEVKKATGIKLSPISTATTFKPLERIVQKSNITDTQEPASSVTRGILRITATVDGVKQVESLPVVCKTTPIFATPGADSIPEQLEWSGSDLKGYVTAHGAFHSRGNSDLAAKHIMQLVGWDVQGPVDGVFHIVTYTALAPLGTLKDRICDLARGANYRRAASRRQAAGQHRLMPGTRAEWTEIFNLLIAKLEQLAVFRAHGIVMPDNKFVNDLVTAVNCLAAIDWDGYCVAAPGCKASFPVTWRTPVTPKFAAPEQLRADSPCTTSTSHVFHLGRDLLNVLFFMVGDLRTRAQSSGKEGWGGAFNEEMLTGLARIAMRCVAEKPSQRPSLAALKADLQRLNLRAASRV